jgi:hypothetical protein
MWFSKAREGNHEASESVEWVQEDNKRVGAL